MSHYYNTLAMLVTVGCLVTLSGCIIDPNQNTAGSNYQPNPGGKAYGAASGASEWDRGCNDGKAGSYDRSGNASQAYEEGWNACRSGGNQSNTQQQRGDRNASEYDRGCADAKAGSYDRSGNAGQAYENGWNACH